MSAFVLTVTEAVGHGVARTATELASLAWLVIIGVPETFGHVRNFITWCRDQWSRCLDHIAQAAVRWPRDEENER